MDLLLGLDVGTTATKAYLFDLEGRVVGWASYAYGLLTPHERWVEQDPEELWRGVVETTRALVAQIGPGDRILALCQSSQAGTTIPVDAAGLPIRNAISWMDGRAVEQARDAEARWGGELIRSISGWPVFDGLPLQHIRWLRENCPQEFARARRFVFVNDFIGYRLTGQLCMNPSDASITQLLNVATADWDERLLDMAGIRRDQLSPLQPSGRPVGRLTAAASAATGLSRDVALANGAHDQYCAAVGIGVTRPGRVLLSCGTAWVILAVPESLAVGLASGLEVSCHAVEGRWGAIRSLGGVGTALEWFLDHVWQAPRAAEGRESLYGSLNAAVARSAPGAGGLVFFTQAGGRAGIGTGRGGFIGLTLAHARAEMARAVMEGIALELRWAIEEICASGLEIAELRMVGGAAKSPIWPRIVADVTGVPVVLPAVRDAASRGAAVLAGVGAGAFRDPESGFALPGEDAPLAPDAGSRALYQELFARYREAWPTVTKTPGGTLGAQRESE